MLQANTKWYCNANCYNDSTQRCVECYRYVKAAHLKAFPRELDALPGSALWHICKGKEKKECRRIQRTDGGEDFCVSQ
jgi:hypothetical protein